MNLAPACSRQANPAPFKNQTRKVRRPMGPRPVRLRHQPSADSLASWRTGASRRLNATLLLQCGYASLRLSRVSFKFLRLVSRALMNLRMALFCGSVQFGLWSFTFRALSSLLVFLIPAFSLPVGQPGIITFSRPLRNRNFPRSSLVPASAPSPAPGKPFL